MPSDAHRESYERDENDDCGDHEDGCAGARTTGERACLIEANRADAQ
jgi:hypothetical protein